MSLGFGCTCETPSPVGGSAPPTAYTHRCKTCSGLYYPNGEDDSPMSISADRPATAFLPSDLQLLRDVANTFNPDTFDEHNKLEDLADKIEATLFPPPADRPAQLPTLKESNDPANDNRVSEPCLGCGKTKWAWRNLDTKTCSRCAADRPVENSELRELLWKLPRLAQALTGHDTVRILPLDEIQKRTDAYDAVEYEIEELFAASQAKECKCPPKA